MRMLWRQSINSCICMTCVFMCIEYIHKLKLIVVIKMQTARFIINPEPSTCWSNGECQTCAYARVGTFPWAYGIRVDYRILSRFYRHLKSIIFCRSLVRSFFALFSWSGTSSNDFSQSGKSGRGLSGLYWLKPPCSNYFPLHLMVILCLTCL